MESGGSRLAQLYYMHHVQTCLLHIIMVQEIQEWLWLLCAVSIYKYHRRLKPDMTNLVPSKQQICTSSFSERSQSYFSPGERHYMCYAHVPITQSSSSGQTINFAAILLFACFTNLNFFPCFRYIIINIV